MNESLTKWVIDELDKRDWTQSKLAKELQTSVSHVSLVLNGVRPATADFCIRVAKLFDASPVGLLELAAIIPRQPRKDDPDAIELLTAWAKLSAEEQRALLAVIKRAGR